MLTVCVVLRELLKGASFWPVHYQVPCDAIAVQQTVHHARSVWAHWVASSKAVVSNLLIIEVGHNFLLGLGHSAFS